MQVTEAFTSNAYTDDTAEMSAFGALCAVAVHSITAVACANIQVLGTDMYALVSDSTTQAEAIQNSLEAMLACR